MSKEPAQLERPSDFGHILSPACSVQGSRWALITEEGVGREPKADVVITADQSARTLLQCVRAVLDYSDGALRLLTVVSAAAIENAGINDLEALSCLDRRVRTLADTTQIGLVRACNERLGERRGDVVLLSADCHVSPGWLRRLAEAAHAEERTACVSPLVETGRACWPAELRPELPFELLGPERLARACAGLPPFTDVPAPSSSCVYLRGDILDAVGFLEISSVTLEAALHDWTARALELGFVSRRANHVQVRCMRNWPGWAEPAPFHEDARGSLRQQHSGTEQKPVGFHRTLDARLPVHALRLESSGKLPVGLDIRHLPREQVGTRTYAVNLARELSRLPQIELTLLIRDPAQANGLSGRVVTAEQWNDDVALIHKPAQVIDPRELELLFSSSAHLVITYQDLISYRIPQTFPNDEAFRRYRAMSGLLLQAVQRILAYSRSAAREISSEFRIPSEEISVVPLGVDAEWFAHKAGHDPSVCLMLGLPSRYFFSLATDFPHKNLRTLLEAYASLQSKWRDGEPPGLVLAGNTSSARGAFYRELKSRSGPKGLTVLGPISSDELRVVYQHALAFVFPSLYEGFGLPPLEAMAAGTPVIAMPISAVPEVAGDCALYPQELSAVGLARAMETILRDTDLREHLRAAGSKRIEALRWEFTASATYEAYRDAVLRPSARSLQMRRLLGDTIMRSARCDELGAREAADGSIDPALFSRSIGIRNAWKLLKVGLRERLRRELRKRPPVLGREPA
jgi:alpha-1,3-rhamnosyl/mannosyltransferase